MPYFFSTGRGGDARRFESLVESLKNARKLTRLAVSHAVIATLTLAAGCTPSGPNPTPTPTPTPTPAQAQLAIAHGNLLTIVDPDTTQTIQEVTRYQEVGHLAYRPDGNRLAVGVCANNRVVEIETAAYNELSVPVPAAFFCPGPVSYSPDNQSLAAAITVRANPSGAPVGHLQINGPQPLDRDMGQPLRAIAYRPGGGELAVVTPQGLTILSTAVGYPTVVPLMPLPILSIAYTNDGDTLIAGAPPGFMVLDVPSGYTPADSQVTGGVTDIAVAPTGGWVAMVHGSTVTVRRATDLMNPVAQFSSSVGFRDAEFSPDGKFLAVSEQTGQVRRFRLGTWQEESAIPASGNITSIAFRPGGAQRVPVLFVHGHSGNSAEAWFDSANGTSFAATLAANPQLPIDAFYLELPVHSAATPNPTRSISDDAKDIQAAIEGGADAVGRVHVGILNMPAYQAIGRVAIIAYSQGTLSSRDYINRLIGSRRNQAMTVSEFVTLAAPNHGVGGVLIGCGNASEPDRTLRQLCAGQIARAGACDPNCQPADFSTNTGNDRTFITDLNGHPLADSCGSQTFPSEAPHSRPRQGDGILYVNLMGRFDGFVGDNTQGGDCAGRRLARNLAPDADNREFTGVPLLIHQNVPHHFEIICTALRTVADHHAPALGTACDLRRP